MVIMGLCKLSIGLLYRASIGLLCKGFSERLVFVRNSHFKDGYIDKTGKMVIPAQFDDGGSFCDGVAYVGIYDYSPEGYVLSSKFGYIDKTGKYVIEPKFDGADDFSEGLATVRTKAGAGFIDKTGNYVIEPDLGWPLPFLEGLSFVSGSYIDKTGKYVWPQTQEKNK